MSSTPTHIPLYSDEKALLEREADVSSSEVRRDASSLDLAAYYELPRTLEWIEKNDFKRVALQFPDHQLGDSASLARYIENNAKNGCKAFILADTSYGKCCVDEVAAEHISADSLIHYGQACMSANSRLPVLYVFGRQLWHVEECAARMKENFAPDAKVVVFFDVQFYHGSQLLKSAIASTFPHIVFTQILTTVDITTQQEQEEPNSARRHKFCGRTFEIAEDSKINDYSILYIGGESVTLTNLLMHYNQMPVWTFNPIGDDFRKETVNANRALMKRFYLIERAKDADIIGIVVGTLAVANYLDILAYLKTIIKAAGKKYYTFVMGKLNIPKLANFAEIDMFVLVACPENSLLDSKEFFRPIVTPFEMEIALVKGKEWSNTYSADFADVLRTKDLKQLQSEVYADGSQATEGEDVRISLVSNKVRVNHKSLAVNDEEETSADSSDPVEISKALARRANLDVALVEAPNASTVFLQRSFQGLQQRLGEDAPHVATEGRAGVASGYDEEPHN